MSKNFASIYNSVNVAISLEQAFFIKEETTRGQLIAPAGTDFLFTLAGGSANMKQPFESSPHRSGRHHTSPIRKKKETSWSIPTYFNIDETLGAASSAEVDPAIRLLHKSMFGAQDLSAGAKYTVGTPDVTFSLFENGDKFAKQTRGAYVDQVTMNLPGNGEANSQWSGAAKDIIYVGLGKSTANNTGGNTITLTRVTAISSLRLLVAWS